MRNPSTKFRRAFDNRAQARGRQSVMTQQQGKARRGRRPKGDRQLVTTRLPTDVVAALDQLAAESGSDRTATLTRVVCAQLNLEVPSYCLPPTVAPQTQLPFQNRGDEGGDGLPKSA